MRKVFTILLVLFPFLNQFGLPVNVPFLTEHLSIGYLVVLPFALLWLLLKLPTEGIFRLKVYGFSGYVLFLLAAAFSAVMARGRGYYAGNRQLLAFGILLLFWFVVLYAARGVFNVRFGMTFYAGITVIFAAYFILQFLVFRFRGIYLPTIFRDSYVFGGSYTDAFKATGIPTSLFLTTRDFALYCLPAVAYLLLWDRIGFNGPEFICAVIISAALVLTKSYLVVAALALIWGLYVLFIFVYFVVHPYDGLYRFTHQRPSRIVLQIVFPLFCAAGAALLLFKNNRLERLLAGFKGMIKDPALTSGLVAGGKAGDSAGTFVRLFGCGKGNVSSYLSSAGISTSGEMSAVGYVFIACGLVGLILFIGSLFALLSTRKGKFGFAMAGLSLFFAVFVNFVFIDFAFFWVMLALVANDNSEMTFKKFLRIRD